MSPQGLLLAGKSRFEIYLRTGVVLTSSGSSLALKYNPWHDIEDGRFTRAGMESAAQVWGICGWRRWLWRRGGIRLVARTKAAS
jgi:hypothetical protein